MLLEPYEERYQPRNLIPYHAFSETDRLMARADEFQACAQAMHANTCWRDWHYPDLTAHDGLVRPDHPLLLAILDRTHSASSLQRLLRNPQGFVWQYGLRLSAPEMGVEPLMLEPSAIGDLVHRVLDRALRQLERSGGWAGADNDRIAEAVARSVANTASNWENEQPVPPAVIWRHTLDEVRLLSEAALALGGTSHPGVRCFSEVPFGGSESKSGDPMPWDSKTPVKIPGTGIRIKGYIDRLDIGGDGKHAFVADYKTGRAPKESIVLNGGGELQRCLYSFATRALLGNNVEVTASLLYPRTGEDFPLPEPEETLDALKTYLNAAKTSLQAGHVLTGKDGGGDYDELAFALPANPAATYCVRKRDAIHAQLGAATEVWEAV